MATSPITEFRNCAPLDFSRDTVRQQFISALREAQGLFPRECPMVIGGRRRKAATVATGTSPSDKALVTSKWAEASADDADKAVEAAQKAFPAWAGLGAEARAAILLRIAEELRRRRYLFAAVEVFEAGKPWREADADVCEAVDFLEYYARGAMRLAAPKRLQPNILGERNELRYDPLGVVGVIGPWNFPLAIPVGMAMAAIAVGNTVVLKPAEQTPAILSLFADLCAECGLPPGVLNYLPGRGEVCGARLVKHPMVKMVVFTGSRDVGLLILREAATLASGQNFVKRVVAEMGGKNAIIVDSSADIDSAIPDVVASAYGFSGQKCSACSRLIVPKGSYRAVLEHLRDAVSSLKVGPAEDSATQMGPVIDEEAAARVRRYIDLGRREARPVFVGDLKGLEARGSFVPPAVFEVASPKHALAQEEIFGPVLAVLKADSFSHALEIANGTDYALTGGVHSRTPSHLERAQREFQVGNLYLNRTITGAIVGRQPFGGFRMSGVGSKAGGPDYLKQFVVARSVTENMMRHGFVPLVEQPSEADED